MRFEVHQVLDAIERRLTTDPALARGVLDIAEVVRYADLDGARPASLLRLGMVIDALAAHLAEEQVQVYAVTGRPLLSDADLTSNERMRIRSWSDDGLVEVLPDVGDRVLEVADLIGTPVMTRYRPEMMYERYPWLATEEGRLLAPVAGAGGAALIVRPATGAAPAGRSAAASVMSRLWRCSEPGCASFSPDAREPGLGLDGPGRARRVGAQPPPRVHGGAPTCPRHEVRLVDAGPRPPERVLSIRVDGVLRQRLVVGPDRPVVIGRSPDEPGGIMLGHWLSETARRWISRSHLRLELRGEALTAVDTSTNGTLVRRGGSARESDQVTLDREQPYQLGAEDVVELYSGVELARVGRWSAGSSTRPASVMADAPTVAIRLPR